MSYLKVFGEFIRNLHYFKSKQMTNALIVNGCKKDDNIDGKKYYT